MNTSITDKLATGNADDLLEGVNLLIDESVDAEIGFVSAPTVENNERAHSAGRLDALRSLKTLINEAVTTAKRNK
tara:strand:+ start:30231 stop:30455 length:225 start_codon:yes stop_codon:yes gene_type:complete